MRPVYFLFISLFILSTSASYSQEDNAQQKQRERYEKELQKQQNELISDFVEELAVDAFQKEIISQKLHSYVQKKQEIMKQSTREIAKRERIDHLDNNHFLDIANMATPEVMLQIRDFITMKHPMNKKKKKKKKNRSKKSDDDQS